MKRCCSWCLKIVESPYNRKTKIYCSTGCRDADAVFNEWMSDEEINRKTHYYQLTRGEPDEKGH